VPTVVYFRGDRVAGISYSPHALYRLLHVATWANSLDQIVPVSIGVSVAFFLIFEIWFSVPLPKGPLEAALGLN